MVILRRDSVKEYIQTKGEVTLDELQSIFKNCSAMTLRRDLIKLEEEGFIKRTRGGAIAISRTNGMEGIYSLRATQNIQKKVEIANKALNYIDGGRSIYLDSGTTLMCLAKSLPDEHCPIMTSGVNIALELVKNPKYNVTLLGGTVNQNTLSVSGNLAINYVESVNIDIAIMGASGFLLETGFTSGTYTENELKKTVIAKAMKTIMLMDSSKFNRIMPLTFATLGDIDILVTDTDPGSEIKQKCKEYNIELVF